MPGEAAAGVWGEAAVVAPPLAHHSTKALHFCGSLGFLHKHSRLQSSSLPSPQAVSLQPTAVPSLGLLSKPHVPAPRPCAHQRTPISGWGSQGCGTDHLCRSHSVLPATDQLLHSPPTAAEAPILSQLMSPLERVFPRCGNLSSPSAPSHQGRRSCPTSSPLPFPFFFPLSCLVMQGSFRCPRSSAGVQAVLCENCSICGCILDAFVGR